MSDPRNVAHAKKVLQEKKHHGENPAEGTAVEKVQPGKKPEMKHPHAHEDPATERAELAAKEVEEIQETVEAHDEKTEAHKDS